MRANLDGGGALREHDLTGYKVERRPPLRLRFGDAEILGNPAPSSGGPLLAFSLGLLAGAGMGTDDNNAAHLDRLANAMQLTDQAQQRSGLSNESNDATVTALLSEAFMAEYQAQMPGRATKVGGTTHISTVDRHGNAAALSVSNGEGCGHILPVGNLMLNNMLGEEDLNPKGFFQWRPNSRITSMMSPTLVRQSDGRILALGSGGSNRIRSAILQVLLNHLQRGQDLGEAVAAPRIHLEKNLLNIESGHDPATVEALTSAYPEHQLWPDRNFFFGGVHAAAFNPHGGSFEAAGDPRRGGSTG